MNTDCDAAEARKKESQDEIGKHEVVLAERKRELNAISSATSCLPPEMLREIILQYHALYEKERTQERQNKKSTKGPRCGVCTCHGLYGWIRITHVCTLWRTIALETPRLWGDLHLRRIDCVEAMLARSKATLVTVNWHKGNFSLLLPVLWELNRVQSLEIFFDEQIWKASEGILPNTLPLPTKLHTLRIGGNVLYAFQKNARSGFSVLSIFGQGLRILSVKQSQSTRLPLRSLSLLDALKNLPLLEEIHLEIEPYPVASSSVDSSSRVTLPHLRSLYLRGATAACLRVLKHLSFPYEARIMLDGQSELHHPFWPEAAFILHSKFPDSTFGHQGATQTFQTLKLYRVSDKGYLQGWRDLLPLTVLNQDKCHGHPAGFKFPLPAVRMQSVFSCDLPLEDVKTLQMDLVRPHQQSIPLLRSWFAKMERVHTISVATSMMAVLSNSLTAALPMDPVLFPYLTTLKFHCLYSKNIVIPGYRERDDLRGLTNALKTRKALGMGIKTLIMQTCVTRDEDDWHFVQMKEFVEEMEWQDCKGCSASFYYRERRCLRDIAGKIS